MDSPRSILITGASSGIGRALATAYAAPGIFLALSGRDRDRLNAVTEDCRRRGAEVSAAVMDVTDCDAMTRWVAGTDTAHPLDLVIANAGISAGTGVGGESAEQAEAVRSTNIDGVFNTIRPAISCMQPRGRGQIAIMSSLAGFLPLPGAPSYAASKKIVREWSEESRAKLNKDGIAVNVICPGFVESRITDKNPFPMPFLMPADRAAEIIKRGLARNQARIAFPWPMVAFVYGIAALPAGLQTWLLARAPKKPALD